MVSKSAFIPPRWRHLNEGCNWDPGGFCNWWRETERPSVPRGDEPLSRGAGWAPLQRCRSFPASCGKPGVAKVKWEKPGPERWSHPLMHLPRQHLEGYRRKGGVGAVNVLAEVACLAHFVSKKLKLRSWTPNQLPGLIPVAHSQLPSLGVRDLATEEVFSVASACSVLRSLMPVAKLQLSRASAGRRIVVRLHK